jgi:Fe-S cluster biosynthesis and repair protein YggX
MDFPTAEETRSIKNLFTRNSDLDYKLKGIIYDNIKKEIVNTWRNSIVMSINHLRIRCCNQIQQIHLEIYLQKFYSDIISEVKDFLYEKGYDVTISSDDFKIRW